MEKVKIKTAIDSGKKWEDKPIITVILEDGRTGSSYDRTFIEKVGQEIEVDIKEGKVYNGVQQHYFNLPKEKNGKGFAQKDWTFEKKKASLESAVNAVRQVESKVSADQIINLANKFYDFLK